MFHLKKKIKLLTEKKFKDSSIVWLFFIFGLFLLSTMTLYFQGPNLISGDDSWYHASSMLKMKEDKATPKPVFHPFSTETKNSHYFLYHKIGSYFMTIEEPENYHINILEYKIYQSILLSILLTVLSLPFLFYFKKRERNLINFLLIYAFIFFLITSSGSGIRFLIERPHVFFYAISILGFYSIISKKRIPLFVLGILSSLFYSVSLMYMIPLLMYVFTEMIYNIFNKKPALKDFIHSLTLSLWGLMGVLLGIVIHPSPYYEFWVGNILHFKQIYTDLFGITLPMSEFVGIYYFDFKTSNILWIALTVFSVILFFSQYKNEKESSYKKIKFSISIFIIIFGISSIFVNRFVEYILIFSIILIGFSLEDIIEIAKEFKKTKLPFERILFLILGMCIFWYLVFPLDNKIKDLKQLLNYSYSFPNKYKERNYQIDTALKLRNITTYDNSIIYNTTNFSQFPILIFFNPEKKFATGYSEIFEYDYNKNNYFLMTHLKKNDSIICPKRICTEGDVNYSIPETLKKIGADYFLLDKTSIFDKEILQKIKDSDYAGFNITHNSDNFILLEIIN